MDRAALASRLDSGWNSSLRSNRRPALHEDPLFVTQACAQRADEVFRYERVSTSAGADPSCLHILQIKARKLDSQTHH